VPVDFAFQANGAIRGGIAAGGPAGDRDRIAFHDLAGAVGFGTGPDGLPGSPLVSVHLTGAEVRRVMEVSVLLSGVLGDSYFLQLSGARVRYSPQRAVALRVPIRGTPIPTGRAVLSATRSTPGKEVPLLRGDTTLYHVVTDRYVASFLPVVGQVVPSFSVVPKDREGRPIVDLDRAIVRRDGAELKVWHAVLEHAAAAPRIPPRYAAAEGRLRAVWTVPPWVWGLLLLAALGAGGAAVLRRRAPSRALGGRGQQTSTLDGYPPPSSGESP
jgi:5'-nucleotidase / UDP-sugar diphosphatase